MKLIPIFFILIAHTHGLLFGDIENVMSSLQSGFQKLITDVVTDVRDTIDCTVVVVESALSLGEVNDSLRRKCSGKAIKKANDKLSVSFLKDKPKTETDPSIKKNPLTSIEKEFRYKNNDDRLNAYFKNELDNISSTFNDELKKIDRDEKATADSVIKYINDVHKAKHRINSSSEVNGVQSMLNRASKTMQMNLKDHNSNINNILTSLGHQSNNNKTSDMQSTISKLNEDTISSNIHDSSRALPKNFKDVFQEESRAVERMQNPNRSEEYGKSQNTGSNTVNLSTHSLKKNVESMESIFGGNSDSDSHNDVLKQAKKFLEEGERSNSFLNNLFEKVDKSGKNMFDSL